MSNKYFRFTGKRLVTFFLLAGLIIVLQAVFTGSVISRQKATVESGNSESAVIGVLDKTEIVRQKFQFKRKVILSEFALSFGSFERNEVGDELKIQLQDGENNIVYETVVPVDNITPNASYRVPMDYTVTIPKGAVCCIKISCSSKGREYDTIPTLNTTNRTDPNTFMSTLKMQTRKKCLNISYTYYYRQIFPFIALIFEFAVLFFLCFERVTEYRKLLIKRKRKETKRQREKSFKKKNDRSLKSLIKWCLVEPKFIKGVRIAMAVFNPLVVMFVIELMHDNLLNMRPSVWIFTWILLLAIQYIFYSVFGNMGIAVLVMNLILFPCGLANLVLLNVRGTPFLPSDLLALQTATEVASTYTISFTPAQFVMLPAFILWCFMIFCIRSKQKETVAFRRIVKRLSPTLLSCIVIGILYNTPILENAKITDNIWNKVASCRSNGFYMNFFLNIHYLSVAKPSGYSQEAIADILDDFKKNKNSGTTASAGGEEEDSLFKSNKDFGTNKSLNGQKPNIILIMNESLADFDLVGPTNFNKDPLEYLHSMEENTIYGKDYVSIYGAGTSNSEFEAMTGNSMKFFPSGCNVYQQFMHDTTFSMAYYLKSLGYQTMAVHPSSGANWNRIKTYDSMRFDDFITIEDFKNPEYIRYISDKESYKKVIELYENKEKGTPLFAFDMTIQNHGGYLTNTNWEEPVYVKGAYYEETKEFLSAINVSDDAFEYLVDYFKEQKEPTIICMFGDHHPSLEIEFYEELLGKKQEDWNLDDIQKRFATPFVIWANYDIEESKNVVLSNNYLENLLLKQAGITLPLYNQYIEKVSELIPAMNVNGYLDYEGIWHNYETDTDGEPDAVQKCLKEYELLQYGYYSDMDKEQMKKIFEMNGD